MLKDVSVVDCSTGGRFHHSSAGAHLGTSLPLRLLPLLQLKKLKVRLIVLSKL